MEIDIVKSIVKLSKLSLKLLNLHLLIHLSDTERQFIKAHLQDDPHILLLRAHPADLSIKKLVEQIVARQKAREKLPSWYANDDLFFPPALSVEQASSERTAQYKASIVDGKLLLDLTGGMGVDTWAFSQRIDQVLYVDRQQELANLAAYNLSRLGQTNIIVRVGDGISILKEPDVKTADWLYLDPHRRDERGGRVVQLADCDPDVTQPGLLPILLNRANQILIKGSPLLDINLTVRQLANQVESVHVVAVQGEVKELLFTVVNRVIDRENMLINSVNLTREGAVEFNFEWQEEQTAAIQFGNPQQYIYEPNAAVLKAGAFRLVASRFGLIKLAPHSHLYTSEVIKPEFPGRIFVLNDVIKPDSKALKKLIPNLKANLTVRNFPQTVAELRKKLALREGGAVYILATTLLNGDKRLLITQKIDV